MRFLACASLFSIMAGISMAQVPGLTLPPSGNNQHASVTQFVGPVRITIDYSSPAVHTADGKDRHGEIWGKLVPYGTANLGFGNGKPSPWRAGANENTVFTVSDDVLVEGKPLPAGRYGLHMIPGADEWTIIFSKNSDAWGSFFYEESEDALRVPVKPHKNDYREWLTYEFTRRTPTETTAELQWEDLAVPVAVKVDHPDDIYISHLKHELTGVPGFNYRGFVTASQYCLQANTHLDLALEWAEVAISRPFVGQANFTTLDNKAQILSKLGRDAEAQTLMQTALKMPGTTPLEIHVYGRRLLSQNNNEEALKVFQYNAERNGDAWPVHVGLARGYAAIGDNQKALEHARKAAAQAPDQLNKTNMENMVKALTAGEKFTQ